MRNLLKKLFRRRHVYEPLIQVEISRSNLVHNLDAFRKLAPKEGIAPVLKSNAYGHGLIEVARVLEHENTRRSTHGHPYIPFFVVDSFFEAAALRAEGIKTHILIIGYTSPESIQRSRGHKTAFTVTTMETLRALANDKKRDWGFETGGMKFSLPLSGSKHVHMIHIKVDTGMHRQGILPTEIPEAIELIKRAPNLILEGVCSHLSDADNTDETYTEGQINVWNHAVKQFKAAFPSLRYWHLSNTDGHRMGTDIDANISRLGIGLYGIPANDALNNIVSLKPVMSMKTSLTTVKTLERGRHVGYSKTFMASKDMMIATIPVGYFEGLDRRLSNTGHVLVGRERVSCPIIGRVSMNISIIDVTHVPNARVGMDVCVISNNQSDPNSIHALAKLCHTITYEIVVHIPAHLKRVVI